MAFFGQIFYSKSKFIIYFKNYKQNGLFTFCRKSKISSLKLEIGNESNFLNSQNKFLRRNFSADIVTTKMNFLLELINMKEDAKLSKKRTINLNANIVHTQQNQIG